MRITDIARQKKNENRWSVFIDHRFAFGVDDSDMARCGLTFPDSIGMELDEGSCDRIIGEAVYAKARDAAIRFLEFRARTYAEVVKKLEEGEFGEAAVERVMANLTKYGYVDDMKFCALFTHDARALNGFGNERVRRELAGKGVDPNVIEDFFETDDFDEASEAVKLLEKRYRRGFPDADDRQEFYKEKRKATDFLYRKGYGWDVINAAFEAFTEGDE